MVKRKSLYVTSVTILDTLQWIVEHLRIRMEWVRGGMHMYISYAINLDTQQNYVEWIEGTLIGILITKGTITKITEGMRMEVMAVREKH